MTYNQSYFPFISQYIIYYFKIAGINQTAGFESILLSSEVLERFLRNVGIPVPNIRAAQSQPQN